MRSGRCGADKRDLLFEGDGQDVVVEKDQGRERLILCARTDAAVTREVVEELLDFARAKLVGVTLAMEDDEAADPSAVSFFRFAYCSGGRAARGARCREAWDRLELPIWPVPCEVRATARHAKSSCEAGKIVCSAWPSPSKWRPARRYGTARARLRSRAESWGATGDRAASWGRALLQGGDHAQRRYQ